jgi:serine/threonine-protein kinase
MPHAPDLSGCALDGRYELHAVIGEGAFGRVYRGRDRRLERPVAIKMIKPWWAEDPEWARSFEREAQLLARVNHPGIVQIFDVGHAAEGLYYVSELIEGESLAGRLRRGRPAPWDAGSIAEQLCRALARAHAENIVHRDVKPANILIATDGQIKVGDFGVARFAQGSSDGASATAVGTPRYMAPEQARGRRPTPATDVYSVGVVLYEMLAGRPPFTERAAVELALRHLNDRPDPLPPGTPKPLVKIVDRALAKQPADRYVDGREMADALARAIESAPATRHGRDTAARSSRPARPGPTATRPARRRGAAVSDPAATRPARRRGAAASDPDTTRPAPRRSPRRNLTPAARRRSAAALASAFLLLGAMLVAALLIGSTGHVRVPRLTGLSRSAVRARAQRLSLQPAFTSRYDRAAKGTVIGQTPRAGRRVTQGSAISVVLSAGPPPVPVPQLAGDSSGDAQSTLGQLGLKARLTQIAAPGVSAGTVTSQTPAPGAKLFPGASVALDVAEVPRWQPLTSVSGSGRDQALSFRVRGTQWRIVYTMAYQGMCTFIFFCSGPDVAITRAGSGSEVADFGLSDGGRQTRVLAVDRGLLLVSSGGYRAGP